jgi:hypothetical protein
MIGKLFSIFLIYCGTCFYTLASFYHLSFKEWSFTKSYLFALPLVAIEYVFNIYGNKYANMNGINVIQIMMLIIGFYMINIWLINIFIIKEHSIVLWRELLALLLLISAIVISSNMVQIHDVGKI